MKTIGLLGGMSWESTVTYYRLINQQIKQRLGGLHSARIALYSIDFADMEKLQREGNWPGAAQILIAAAKNIESSGADLLLICTNTMHIVAQEVQAAISIPLVHIADATAEALTEKGFKRVGLLGTAFTMEQDFYKGRLRDNHGLDVLIPNADDRKIVHQVIYQELCQGQVQAASKKEYLRIVNELKAAGAEAIILGCTEIGLLIQQDDTDVPLFDTTSLHSSKAVDLALDA